MGHHTQPARYFNPDRQSVVVPEVFAMSDTYPIVEAIARRQRAAFREAMDWPARDDSHDWDEGSDLIDDHDDGLHAALPFDLKGCPVCIATRHGPYPEWRRRAVQAVAERGHVATIDTTGSVLS